MAYRLRYQFTKEPIDHGGLGNLEPVDEATIAGHIQEQLDELRKMGLVVLIGRGLQYVNVKSDADQSAPIPMLTGTICVERESLLRKPDGFKVHSEQGPRGSQQAAQLAGRTAAASRPPPSSPRRPLACTVRAT